MRKSLRFLTFVLALAVALFVGVPRAHANSTIVFQSGTVGPDSGGGIFDVNGTLADTTTFAGTITIDTTTGLGTASTLAYAGDPFSIVAAQASYLGLPIILYQDANNSTHYLELVFDATTLVGYDGGQLCSYADLCLGGVVGAYRVITPVPEPGSLALLGSGLVGVAGMLRRKFNA